MNNTACLTLAALSLGALSLADGLSAQSSTVVPAKYTHADAPASIPFPFLFANTRVQHLIEGDRFCTTSAVIRGFSYRADGRNSSAKPALSLPNTTIKLGYTSNDASTMSTSFASNILGAQTTVFSGTLNLPAQGANNGLGKFDITHTFTQPFVYTRSQGNLLIEHLLAGTSSGQLNYAILDAAVSGVPWGKWGTGGAFQDQSRAQVTIPNPTTVVTGGSIGPANQQLTSAYPTIHIYGFSSVQYGPLPLPFDLTSVGAPGNTLYCSLDLLVPATLQGGGSSWTASSMVPIPNTPSLNGFTIFVSSIHVDLQANALGLVFGPALGTSVGWQKSCGMQQAYAMGATSANGQFWNSGGHGAPMIELSGIFQ